MLASGVYVSALAVFQLGGKKDFFIFFVAAYGPREEKVTDTKILKAVLPQQFT